MASPTSKDVKPSGAAISTIGSSRLSHSKRSAVLITACISYMAVM
ncbi:Uncharacterised protein [Mycobacteroides abscessus subsp. abscessus]|nr:Uncharacterised protein [Mycobacteroides abscessus subsp. abscessus]